MHERQKLAAFCAFALKFPAPRPISDPTACTAGQPWAIKMALIHPDSRKGTHMSNEITSAVAARMSQPIDRAPAVPAASNGIAHPDIKAPVKADIQYDPAQVRRNLEEAMKRLNDKLQHSGSNLNFSMDSSTKQLVIVVKNSETGEVVRQIPNEAVLRVAHNLDDLKGLMLNASS